jgi:hypothetical protein
MAALLATECGAHLAASHPRPFADVLEAFRAVLQEGKVPELMITVVLVVLMWDCSLQRFVVWSSVALGCIGLFIALIFIVGVVSSCFLLLYSFLFLVFLRWISARIS